MSENNVATHGRRGPSDPLLGSQLGPYQVVRLIGSGGMGRVYEGRQTGPINKKVALKVMRREVRSDLMRRRFEMELQTLAALNHPNIATIYLSGTRADGENWFAMEYVEGASLIDYCEQHRLKAPERLKLFAKICGAVHFAHQRGVIHRDLKPANILVREVDGEAVPKVIDFGIAKITAEEKPCLDQATMVTELTAPGFAVGTLGYMSPEQTRLDEDDIDVRSDIYSLGVILYEMLVGKRPIDEKRIQSGTWDQAFALVREHEPEKPSKAIRREALSHQTTLIDISSVSGLSKYYRGDLDWIVLKAMEKNRERRYQGADLFADDIDNFLNRRPIEAGPPTWAYQSKRFIQRNKALVAGMVLVTAGLIFSLVGLVFGYIRAKERENIAIEEARSARTTLSFLEGIIGAQPIYNGKNTRIVDQININTPKINDQKISSSSKLKILPFLGQTHRRIGNLDKAEEIFQSALDINRTKKNQKDLDWLDTELNLYATLKLKRKTAGLDKKLKTLLTEYQCLAPSQTERLIQIKLEIVSNDLTNQNYTQAKTLLEEIEHTDWTKLKDGQFYKLLYLCNLGSYYASIRSFKDSIHVTEQALEIANRYHYERSPVLMRTCFQLPVAYANLNDFNSAIRVNNELIDKYTALIGHDHPQIIRATLNSHHIYRKAGRYEESINIVMNTLSRAGRTADAFRPNVLTALTNTSRCLDDLGYHEDALYLIEQVLTEKQFHIPDDKKSILISFYFLINSYNKLKLYSNTINSYPIFMEDLKSLPSSDTYILEAVIPAITLAYIETNQPTKAQELECFLLDRIITVRTTTIDEHNQLETKIKELTKVIKGRG